MLNQAGFYAHKRARYEEALQIIRRAGNYAIMRPCREMLYSVVNEEEKYKAKAFIDMFVQRFAKALAVGLSLLITTLFTGFESIRWLSLLTVAILVLWILAARYAGRVYRQKEAAS